ncbi:MAG: YgaP family membrane protein [Anaerolineales bacterium]
MNQVFEFLASSAGRFVRAIAGLILIAIGIWLVSGVWQWVLIIVGLVPLAAGVFDFCVFAPLFRLPFNGQSLRNELATAKK